MHVIEITDSQDELDKLLWIASKSKYQVIDTETTGLDYFKDKIISLQLLFDSDPNTVYFIDSLNFIKNYFSLSHLPIIAHNFKFDFRMIYQQFGIDLRNLLLADTMLLDHLLDENQEHSLDSIVKRRYNDNYKEVFWSKYETFQEAARADQIEYSCKDVYYTNHAYRDISHDLSSGGIPEDLISHVRSLGLSLYGFELKGIKLDLAYLQQKSQELQDKISSLRTEMRTLTELECQNIEIEDYLLEIDKRKTDKGKSKVKRPTFNFDSNQKLCRLLYDQLELPEQYNKERNRSVDDGSLEAIEAEHKIVPRIREYRGYQKVFTSFIEGSLKKMHEGRIYPSFNVNGTVTGRLSSSNPNLQQLPTEGGIRGIYIPEPDYVFLSCDYSQLEVVIAAHFSKDKNLLKVVHEGASLHDITAAGLGIDRASAKKINFALQYGAGAFKIQSILSCDLKTAEKVLHKYWETYSGLRDFILECHKKVEKGENLVTPFGRRRRFPKDTLLNKYDLERAKRQAANFMIQSTGADLTNKAYYLIDAELREKGYGYALFPIHDEILVCVKNSYCTAAKDILESKMKLVGEEIALTVSLKTQCSEPMLRWSKG